MRMSFGQEMRMAQKQVLAPRMIQSMEILQMAVLALEERIEQEIQNNETLEVEEAGWLRLGDVVTITRLDRLARSTADLLAIAERIKEAGAGLRSLAEPWADTTTPAGRMVLTVFAGIADFERSLIVERTSAGRIAAKARGVRFGPTPALSAEQIAHARQLIHEDKKPVAEVARLLGVHRATLYRAIERNNVNTH